MRQGIVVDVHPEDHSVDLVMMDDGSRMIGVQVMSHNGSTRSGSVNMPSAPKKKDKWDITKRTGQDQIALVGFIRNNPVVVGYLFPQISQMTFKEKDRAFSRHTSDVYTTTDEKGNMELYHPSGAYVRIAESPEHEDLEEKNFDKSLKLDRNKERRVHLMVKIGSASLHINPDGEVVITASKVTMSTPLVDVPAGDVRISGISFLEHVHGGIIPGPDNTLEPVG
jgi:hypothetical protein